MTLKILPGVGSAIAKKLIDAGLATVNAIALTPRDRLITEEAGLGREYR